MHPDLLTLEQRTLLRKLGGWMIADALIAPTTGCAALRTSMWGGTYRHGSDHAFFECTKRGIVVYAYSAPHGSAEAEDFADAAAYEQALGRHGLLLVRWSQFGRYAAALPAPVREALRRARRPLQVGWLTVCGPNPAPGRRPAERDPSVVTQLYAAHRAAAEVPQQLDLFEISA